MANTMTRARLEKKYGIKIRDDSYYNPFGRLVKLYKIFTADGCQWENGLHGLAGVEAECKKWEKELLEIKAATERRSA